MLLNGFYNSEEIFCIQPYFHLCLALISFCFELQIYMSLQRENMLF